MCQCACMHFWHRKRARAPAWSRSRHVARRACRLSFFRTTAKWSAPRSARSTVLRWSWSSAPHTLCNRWACRSDRRADIPSDARCRARHARRDATNAPSHLSRPRPTSVLAGAGHAVGRLLVAAQCNPVLRTLPPACCAQPSQLFTKTRSRPLAPPGLRNSRRASLRESSTRPRRASHTALAWEYHAR